MHRGHLYLASSLLQVSHLCRAIFPPPAARPPPPGPSRSAMAAPRGLTGRRGARAASAARRRRLAAASHSAAARGDPGPGDPGPGAPGPAGLRGRWPSQGGCPRLRGGFPKRAPRRTPARCRKDASAPRRDTPHPGDTGQRSYLSVPRSIVPAVCMGCAALPQLRKCTYSHPSSLIRI